MGKIAFVGEGGTVEFNPSPDIIHDQKTIYGSWVTSTWLMEELVERLVRWNLHPADIITHRFGLEDAADAYALMASGKCGKVAVCSDEELILEMSSNWEEILKDRLQLYGHRNWLVIADSAYPAQSRDGIETIVADEEQTTVLEDVRSFWANASTSSQPFIPTQELKFVSEEDARGITAYRDNSNRSFEGTGSAASCRTKRSSPSSIASARCFECC